jgi:hypothetical protein
MVMKADEESVQVRSKLEAVENLLKDERIQKDLQDEIRQHYYASQSVNSVDQTVLFRYDEPSLPERASHISTYLVVDLCSRMSHSLQVEVASCIAR